MSSGGDPSQGPTAAAPPAGAAGSFVINAPGAKATPSGRHNGTTASGKKLIMRPLKLKPQLPANFEEETWARLAAAVAAINSKQPVATSLEELYRAVEDMCRHGMAARLYARLAAALDVHVSGQLAALQGQTSLAPAAFLEQVAAMWQELCAGLLLTRSIFLPLDRSYVMTLPGLRSLVDTGLTSLRTHLAAAPKVQAHIIRGLLDLIQRERDGEAVDRSLLVSLVRMMSDLGLYGPCFFPLLLSETGSYYQAEGQRLMESEDVPTYLAHAEGRLQQEGARCMHYLDPSSRRPLLHEAEKQLLASHTPALLSKGFVPLMAAQRVPDLARMYGLLGRVGGTEPLQEAWRQYITGTGTAIVKDEANDKDMVARLLALKASLDRVLRGAFASHPAFAMSLAAALVAAVNARANVPAELIAKHIDALLRGGGAKAGAGGAAAGAAAAGGGSSKAAAAAAAAAGGGGAGAPASGPTAAAAAAGGGEGELEAQLDAALVLFGYIQGKDVFEAWYKRHLAKRLLLGRCASLDAEKGMISKLKVSCGGNFTANIEGMFRDMDVASETMELFRRHAARQQQQQEQRLQEQQQQQQQDGSAPTDPGSSSSQQQDQQQQQPGSPGQQQLATHSKQQQQQQPGVGIDVSVTVLTQAHWPTQTLLQLNLPKDLLHWQSLFCDFYGRQYSSYRQLVWQHSLSTAMLRANFPKGGKELSVSLLQALVLLLFNDADSLSYEAIKGQVAPSDDRELQRTLLSLSVGKVRVLLKSPKGPTVSPGDTFAYNAAFTAPLFRIRVNNIQLKESPEEAAKTNEQVVQERQHAIDAAIVRVMKARKSLGHKLLVGEVMSQLRFSLTNADLKRRIDNLIEREFLERSEADAQVYNYLA